MARINEVGDYKNLSATIAVAALDVTFFYIGSGA